MAPKKKIPAVGSRAQVWHGTAKHTSGGLYKKDLKKNKKTGRIVSKKASAHSKKMYKKNCEQMATPFTKKGKRPKKCPKKKKK